VDTKFAAVSVCRKLCSNNFYSGSILEVAGCQDYEDTKHRETITHHSQVSGKAFRLSIDNKTIASSAKKVPATYKKNFPSWDKMGKYQKMVMINAWENASIDTKESLVFQFGPAFLE
jgi:hypothetical protein